MSTGEIVTTQSDANNNANTLEDFYRPMPGKIVEKCERLRARIVVHQDTLGEDLRKVREILGPYGGFKEWCGLAGIDYMHARYLADKAERIEKGSDARQIANKKSNTESTVAVPDHLDRALTVLGKLDTSDQDELKNRTRHWLIETEEGNRAEWAQKLYDAAIAIGMAAKEFK